MLQNCSQVYDGRSKAAALRQLRRTASTLSFTGCRPLFILKFFYMKSVQANQVFQVKANIFIPDLQVSLQFIWISCRVISKYWHVETGRGTRSQVVRKCKEHHFMRSRSNYKISVCKCVLNNLHFQFKGCDVQIITWTCNRKMSWEKHSQVFGLRADMMFSLGHWGREKHKPKKERRLWQKGARRKNMSRPQEKVSAENRRDRVKWKQTRIVICEDAESEEALLLNQKRPRCLQDVHRSVTVKMKDRIIHVLHSTCWSKDDSDVWGKPGSPCWSFSSS